jgi:signal transduction histidine kinase
MPPLPPDRSREELDLWHDERTPTWRVLLPLLVVIAALVALAVVPALITERNAALRQALVDVYTPLGALVSSLERATASELASARAYALTGDPFFVDRFLEVHAYGNTIGEHVDSLAGILGGEVAVASQDLLDTRARWAEANFGRTRADFREGLPEHQQHYEATMGAAQNLASVLARRAQAHMDEIRASERLRDRVSALLAVVALFAAGAALWLAQRLLRSGRYLLRRARDEAALRRIAQTMAEAEDLPGALHRIVDEVAHVTDADHAYVEEVDRERGEVVVVAGAGHGAPEVGLRAPFAGSPAERVLASGQAEQASAESMTFRRGAVGQQSGARSGPGRVLVVPLVSEGEALGVLILDRASPKRPFDSAEMRRVRLLADMAALALRRLRLFEEVRRHEQALERTAAELRLLNETLEERVRERTRKVHELARALTLAEQRERQQLAQALHDDLQQVLFGLQLSVAALERRVGSLSPEGFQRELLHAHNVIGEAIEATRRLTVDLSPPIKAGEGLREAIDWLADHVRERFKLKVEVRADEKLPEPEGEMRLLLFQIARELLFNTVKHSGTDEAAIELSANDGTLIMEVSDEGKGFDPATATTTSTVGGFGLRRARERLALFGGTLEVSSEPGRGTRTTMTVPIDPAAQGANGE